MFVEFERGDGAAMSRERLREAYNARVRHRKEGKVRTRSVGIAGAVTAVIAVAWLLPVDLAAQKAAPPKARAATKAPALPRTPWGDPDLQGTWTNATTTPLERLPEAQGKSELTEEERAALARQVQARLDQDKAAAKPGEVI